jgi:hypothetical protein
MLTQIVDKALSATFQALHVLSRLRNRSRSTTPAEREEDRLTAEWVEARREELTLQNELDHPTSSRLYSAQKKLVEGIEAAETKCHALLLKLRARRKLKSDSDQPPP